MSDPTDRTSHAQVPSHESARPCDRSRGARTWIARVAIIAGIGAAFAHNTLRTWQRWGDIIIDCGRELDTPRQILAGKTLYADIRYWYGPLAPYTNAVLYGLFGTRVGVLTTAGLVSAAITSLMVYRVLRLFAGRAAALATAVAFLYVNAFGHYYMLNVFNFVLPYAYPATYGAMLGLATIWFLLRHVRKGRRRDLFVSCGLLALAALTKVEVLFAAIVAHIAFLACRSAGGRPQRFYLAAYSLPLGVPLFVYGYFYARAGSGLVTENLFLAGNVAASAFTLRHSGLADVAESLRQVRTSALGMAACLLLLRLAFVAERRVRRDPTYDAATRALAIGTLAATGAAVCGGIFYWMGVFRSLRALPVLLLLALLAAIARMAVRPDGRRAAMAGIVLTVYGLAGAARMVLRCGAEHYGFYLLVPGLLGFAAIWTRWIPRWLGARAGVMPVTGYLGGVGMLAGLTVAHAVQTTRSARLYYSAGEPVRIEAARGTMACLGVYVGTVDEAVRFLQQSPGARVVVIPEGAGITFLAGCDNPLGVHTFLPIDLCGAYSAERIVQRLAEVRPDFIVLNARDVSEYGQRGLAYARTVTDWVSRHYTVVRDFRTKTFLVRVLAPRGGSP